jgi:hypothetical protein
MSDRQERTPTEDLLVIGLDDWADVSWGWTIAFDAGVEGFDARRATTFGLIAQVVFQGLMVPGDIVDGAHVAWTCSAAEAVERIVNEWLTEWGDEVPTPGAIVWLANTPRADEIAHAVLAREEVSG